MSPKLFHDAEGNCPTCNNKLVPIKSSTRTFEEISMDANTRAYIETSCTDQQKQDFVDWVNRQTYFCPHCFEIAKEKWDKAPIVSAEEARKRFK